LNWISGNEVIMAKRASTAVSLLQTMKNAMAALEAAVQKQSKETLAAALMDLAKHDQSIRRKLEQKFNVKVPPVDLVVATRAAICGATDFEECDMNTNFEIDYKAYPAVRDRGECGAFSGNCSMVHQWQNPQLANAATAALGDG
jgi:hypothetical protein